MSNKIENVKRALSEKLDISKDIILEVPKITIIGREEITIEHHKGIIVFEKNIIRVNTKIKVIKIVGENFEIIYIGESTLSIKGEFISIEYEG